MKLLKKIEGERPNVRLEGSEFQEAISFVDLEKATQKWLENCNSVFPSRNIRENFLEAKIKSRKWVGKHGLSDDKPNIQLNNNDNLLNFKFIHTVDE